MKPKTGQRVKSTFRVRCTGFQAYRATMAKRRQCFLPDVLILNLRQRVRFQMDRIVDSIADNEDWTAGPPVNFNQGVRYPGK